MFSQYFAQYLLNRGKLTPAQVREALEDEHKHRVKIGVIAMKRGFMTAEQVEKVRKAQSYRDRRFGEVAVEAGFLTRQQCDALLETQENTTLNFTQALIDKQFMTWRELEDALAAYNSAGNSAAYGEAIAQAEFEKIDFSQMEEIRSIYTEYIALFLRSLVRFMDTVGILVPETTLPQEEKWLISQRMTGDQMLATGIWLTEPVLLEMACRYSGERLQTVNAFAVDCLKEFLNVVNGMFVVRLSDRHFEMDLEMQKAKKNAAPHGNQQVVATVNMNFGPLQLVIAADGIQ